MKVMYSDGLNYEDNYASGVYLALTKKVMTIRENFYFYRCNLNGISKSKNSRLYDVALIFCKLIID